MHISSFVFFFFKCTLAEQFSLKSRCIQDFGYSAKKCQTFSWNMDNTNIELRTEKWKKSHSRFHWTMNGPKACLMFKLTEQCCCMFLLPICLFPTVDRSSFDLNGSIIVYHRFTYILLQLFMSKSIDNAFAHICCCVFICVTCEREYRERSTTKVCDFDNVFDMMIKLIVLMTSIWYANIWQR